MSYQSNSLTNPNPFTGDSSKTIPFTGDSSKTIPFTGDSSKTIPFTGDSSKLKIIKDKVEQTKQQTILTIDKALQRNTELDNLIDRAENLESGSKVFYRRSNKLKKQVWCEYCKKKICLVTMIIVVLVILILVIILESKKKHHQ